MRGDDVVALPANDDSDAVVDVIVQGERQALRRSEGPAGSLDVGLGEHGERLQDALVW